MLTNEELYDNAPDDIWEAINNWFKRHPRPVIWDETRSDYKSWEDWATANFLADPEIRGSLHKYLARFDR
jgi:hypothetical protein